ncbi:MAG: hypothetical protein AAFT19_11320 [Pseudomonadota bacterium]
MTMASLMAKATVKTVLGGVLVACAALTAGPTVAEPADPWRYVWRVETQPKNVPGLDCTFFRSQAFNQEDAHFSAQMAAMCEMLSSYKKAIITSNSVRFRADYIERESVKGGGANPVPEGKSRDLPIASDTGKYLIAREIGLIDALAAAPTSAPIRDMPLD